MTEQAHVGAPVLEAENLSIQFGGLKALQELSFSIPEKTVFSIIGPNGAGKTTFFNIVTGIYRPTGGDVRLYGESIVGLEPEPHRGARRLPDVPEHPPVSEPDGAGERDDRAAAP